ncbi:MAG: DUF5343 domain-containing protein [Verrucomicrobiota bacterium]
MTPKLEKGSIQDIMADNPPYLISSGTLTSAFEKIKNAATPERFTGDFVATVLGIKGGTGAALPPFFKRIGFVRSDGTPSELYNQFRNPGSSKKAAATAFRTAYKQLFERNEFIHKASDEDLKGVVVEATGLEPDNRVVSAIVGTFKAFRQFCDFDKPGDAGENVETDAHEAAESERRDMGPGAVGVGMNLAYTINLNLPATDDIKVFDAIFKSLKEHLLKK